jgi:hypothetical protein
MLVNQRPWARCLLARCNPEGLFVSAQLETRFWLGGFGSNPVGRRSDKYSKVRVFSDRLAYSPAADRLRNAGTIPREVLNYNLETLNYRMSLKAWFFRSLQGELRYDLLLFALVYVSLRLVQMA